jgi:hypothetical protein
MKGLLEKLNYKGQKRIAIINAEASIIEKIKEEAPGIITDIEIDPRCPYEFIMAFVKSEAEVSQFVPQVLHNLAVDGKLWFCYPKKTSKKYRSTLERDKGWKALNNMDYFGIRMVAIDEDWSAMRFRNKKFIKSASGRFEK